VLDLSEEPVEKLVELLHVHSVSGVILSAKHAYFEQVEAGDSGVPSWKGWKRGGWRTSSRRRFRGPVLTIFYGWPVLVFRSAPEVSWEGLVKQLLDLAGSLGAAGGVGGAAGGGGGADQADLAGAGVIPAATVGVERAALYALQVSDHGEQRRAAQARLAAMNEMSGPVFKVSNDPRVTPLGKFLRKFSVDEFSAAL